jgi:hypothetical protein
VSERKLHIGEDIWTWRFSGHSVLIRSPERKKHHTYVYELQGVSPAGTERDAWKGNLHVTPREVKEYIRVKILGLPPEDTSDQYGCCCGGVYKHKGMAGSRRRFACTGCEGVVLACELCDAPRADWGDPKQRFCLLCAYYFQEGQLSVEQEKKLWQLAEGNK